MAVVRGNLKKGVVKRSEKRELGIFIDGVSLDRATRRMGKKVEYSALIKSLSLGMKPLVLRYYTLIPSEDDSRQHSFLDAVSKAGITVVVKRLPPKNIERQVSVEAEMAADITAFAMGLKSFGDLSIYKPYYDSYTENPEEANFAKGLLIPAKRENAVNRTNNLATEASAQEVSTTDPTTPTKRLITVLCPTRDLAYAIALATELGADTTNADFSKFASGDILKSAAKWIDLSDSETIWRV